MQKYHKMSRISPRFIHPRKVFQDGLYPKGLDNRNRKTTLKQATAVLITNTFCIKFYWFSVKLQNVIINRTYFNKCGTELQEGLYPAGSPCNRMYIFLTGSL